MSSSEDWFVQAVLEADEPFMVEPNPKWHAGWSTNEAVAREQIRSIFQECLNETLPGAQAYVGEPEGSSYPVTVHLPRGFDA